jgi:hypothetical protein
MYRLQEAGGPPTGLRFWQVRFVYKWYEGNSISKLQIQVATYVFELSAGNCHRYLAALSSFIVTHNDRYAHDCTDVAAVTRWQRP